MFERVVLDLVVVVTPPTFRVPPVTEALQRGISVLCEKPLSSDLASADRMVEVAERSDAVLSVHHQFSPTAVLLRCRELIDSGAIGEPIMIRGRAKAGRRAGIELLEIGTHLAEIMLALAGRPDWCSAHIYDGERLALPRDVRGSLAVAPEEADLGPVVGTRVAASYGFPGGILGEMHFVGHEERMPANYGVDIFGTTGQLALRASRHVTVPLCTSRVPWRERPISWVTGEPSTFPGEATSRWWRRSISNCSTRSGVRGRRPAPGAGAGPPSRWCRPCTAPTATVSAGPRSRWRSGSMLSPAGATPDSVEPEGPVGVPAIHCNRESASTITSGTIAGAGQSVGALCGMT